MRWRQTEAMAVPHNDDGLRHLRRFAHGEHCRASNSVAVIRHDTEMGANAQDQPVAVTFCPVYMHPDTIGSAVCAGPIYRKKEIGEASFIWQSTSYPATGTLDRLAGKRELL